MHKQIHIDSDADLDMDRISIKYNHTSYLL